MNVIVVGKFTDAQFGFHIADTMEEMGHIVFKYDPSFPVNYYKSLLLRRLHQFNNIIYTNLLMTPSFRNYKRQKLYKELRKNKIDLIICTHDFLQPNEINKIRTISKSKIVMWFPDAVANFGKSSFMVADYDAVFFKDPYIVQVLREQYNKKNVFYLPECCNPKYHKSVELNSDDHKKYDCDISTYGSPHNVRSAFFSQLINQNYSIKIWGHQPPIWLKDKVIKTLYTGVYVFNESKAKAVLAARININTLHPSEVVGLNARAFEIAGIGGFQLIHWRQGLSQLFEEGKELVSFKNFEELKMLLNYFLNHEKERLDIAKQGQLRGYRDHTYMNRIQLLLKTTFENGNGFEMPNF
jgi:spore maturation protein CgeB